MDLVNAIDVIDRPIRILDMGGSVDYWESFRGMWDRKSLEIHIINLNVKDEFIEPCYHLLHGNACDLPEYPDKSFDIVHSNSVIEHVGHWREMTAMAREIERLGASYFIQTPNLWFPLEAHYQMPFMQFLPEATRARMLLKKQRGYVTKKHDLHEAMLEVQGINLLTREQMRVLFPNAEILAEKIFGFSKSIMAIKRI
jgi:hypothetical protein